MKPMQTTATLFALTALLLAAWATGAHATPPLVTEDADVLARSACEWSYELQRGTNGTNKARGWVTHAGCGVSESTQIHGSFTRAVAAGVRDDAVSLDGKTALVKREGRNVGVALAYGWAGARQAGNALKTDSTTIGLLFSQSYGSAWTGHANVGWLNVRSSGRTATWGLAAEYALTEEIDLVAESFGESGTRPWMSAGLRWAVSDKATVYAAYAIQRDTPRLVLTTVGLQLGF